MHNKLSEILQTKEQEVALLLEKIMHDPQSNLAKYYRGELKYISKKNTLQILAYENQIKIIAEIKRRSPARGDFSAITDPLTLAKQYIAGGASAVSILTDTAAFGGSLNDLEIVSQAPETTHTPLLRKDFLIHPIQIAESILHGADFILLIVAVLENRLSTMLQSAHTLGIPALVEVYQKDEIQMAIDAGAEMILVNNRNLKTFETNTNSAFQLAPYLPNSVIKIAASGVFETTLTQQYHQTGYAGVLVGEALVKSNNPAEWIKACRPK